MSDLEAMPHLPHLQNEYYVLSAVYEVHQPDFVLSPQCGTRVKAVLKCVHILTHHTSHLDVLAYDFEVPSLQYSRTPNKDCCYCGKVQELSADPGYQTYTTEHRLRLRFPVFQTTFSALEHSNLSNWNTTVGQ
jgi:hypothetical protein